MPRCYEEALTKITEKFRRTAETAAAAGIIPYGSVNGKWIASPYDGNSWWTGGFWPGLMWQFRCLTGDDFFLQEARRTEKLLTEEFRNFRLLNHDVGFMYLLSCGADAKLTGDEQAETDMLHAASLLMGRFNPAGFIRAWNEPERTGYAIIDCMMNLTLLYRASRDTGDPRFRLTAGIHADTTLREFLRENGSVSHIIEFDPETGKRIREHPGQGYGPGSQWSRGQAWGLYGFALAYRHMKEPKYLEAAEKIAANFAAHIRGDGLTVLPSVPDALSICGMGGKTMSDILEKGMDRAFGARLILSPQTEIPLVRRTLYALGYHITDEKCVVASGRFYVIICSETGKASISDEECELGPCLLRQAGREPVRDYYLWKIGVYSAARNESARIRIKWIRDALGKHAAQRGEAEESEGSPPAPCEAP